MKITYRIEQYEVDNFIVVITSPEYLAGLHTRIHTPYFLLSELQQHIKTNLNQTIRRFCIKHKQYADILHNETFEFEPDEHDRRSLDDNTCWFYTGKFIDDTEHDFTDEERNAIYYENYQRDTNQIKPIFQLKMNREGKYKPIVFQKSFKNNPIYAHELIKYFGIKREEIDYWARIQKDWCSTAGNNKNNVYFPRFVKEGGRNVYPIREINIFFALLYKHDRPKYDFLVRNFKNKWQPAF